VSMTQQAREVLPTRVRVRLGGTSQLIELEDVVVGCDSVPVGPVQVDIAMVVDDASLVTAIRLPVDYSMLTGCSPARARTAQLTRAQCS